MQVDYGVEVGIDAYAGFPVTEVVVDAADGEGIVLDDGAGLTVDDRGQVCYESKGKDYQTQRRT